ncbi:TPA: hypothetical protein NJT77_001309 [Corynebacterium striatum]|nr:hypothetical protein [Corynebacterium striatum]
MNVYSMERQFIGALMHSTAAEVLKVSRFIDERDFCDRRLSAVYCIIVKEAEYPRDPDPVVVLENLQSNLGRIRARDMGNEIFEMYSLVPTRFHLDISALGVLKDSARRAFEDFKQLADMAQESSFSELNMCLTELNNRIEYINRRIGGLEQRMSERRFSA